MNHIQRIGLNHCSRELVISKYKHNRSTTLKALQWTRMGYGSEGDICMRCECCTMSLVIRYSGKDSSNRQR